MTKIKGKIRLAEKPYKIINWFTNNYEYEVCAFGLGEVVDGEIYIEKLVFPKQKVNSCHVQFDPEDWSSVFKQLEGDEMDKIIFYWHKHPGSTGASDDDEKNTFDVLMDESAGRTIFGFMQTASENSGDGFKYEARIDIRNTPLSATITDVELVTDSDYKIKEECEQVIKNYCVEPSKQKTKSRFKRGNNIRDFYDVDNDRYRWWGDKTKDDATDVTSKPCAALENKSKLPDVEKLLLNETEVMRVVRYHKTIYWVVMNELTNWVEDELFQLIEQEKVKSYIKDTTWIQGSTIYQLKVDRDKNKQLAKELREFCQEYSVQNIKEEVQEKSVDDWDDEWYQKERGFWEMY